VSRIRTIIAVFAATAVAVAVAGPAGSGTAAAESIQTGADKNIVRTAASAGNFKTLISLLKQAGLARTLRGKGPYTVFAPTDAAFAKVPDATLQTVAADKARLRSVLLYHVAKGKLSAATVAKRRSVKTLNGQRVAIRVRANRVFVGGARVISPDVGASNGVIHAINRVLIPG
jgi:uncharacterized surface protein with fasciclin (FAS1) repeats